jgi:hypothetical protein
MPIATRNAEVTWDGSLARGRGVLSSGSHALQDLPVTWAARTETPEGQFDCSLTNSLLYDEERNRAYAHIRDPGTIVVTDFEQVAIERMTSEAGLRSERTRRYDPARCRRT